jgi:hypothetical protein
MARKKPLNPFFAALLPIGVVFALTACAFVVMMMQRNDPRQPEASGLVALMSRHGIAIISAELAALAVLTVAAIGSDDFWVRRFEAAQSRQANAEDMQ